MLCTTEIGHWMSGPTIAVFISNSQHCHSIILIRGITCILFSATNSTGATQHISANHRSRLQQRSLALVVGKPIKNENISLNFKVSVLSVAPVEFVAL